MKLFPLVLNLREAIFARPLEASQLGIPAAQQAISIEALSVEDADVTAPAFDVRVCVKPDQIKQAVEPTISRHYGRRRTDQITADKAVSSAANPIIIEPSSTSISRLHRTVCSIFVLV